MKYFQLAVALITLCVLTSCNGKTEREFYEDGNLLSQVKVDENGLRKGMYRRYYPDGTLAETTPYVAGKREGLQTMYAEDGSKESDTEYSDDKMNGFHKVYFPSGQLQINSVYKDNEIVGIFEKYYENGKLAEKVNFKDNKENGPFEEYHENGKLKWRGTYRDGDNEFGLLENFNEEGELVKKMMCDSMRICKTIWEKES